MTDCEDLECGYIRKKSTSFLLNVAALVCSWGLPAYFTRENIVNFYKANTPIEKQGGISAGQTIAKMLI